MLLMSQLPYVDNPIVPEELEEVLPNMNADTGNAELIALGGAHACAVGASGNMKCWGNGSSGQLGLGNTQDVGDDSLEQGEDLPFVNLGSGLTISSLALGDSHSCAMFSNGSVKCWGNSQLLGLGLSSSSDGFGDGYLETGEVLNFLDLPGSTTATLIEAGARHTCAVLSDNSLICWGRNDKGQLGLGDTIDRGDDSNEVGDDFDAVSLPTSRTVSQLALGNDHTCAIWDDGSVSCWGGNDHGQLGYENTDDIGDGASEMGTNLGFVSLPGGNSALNITAGNSFTCVILDTSPAETYCWGLNDAGQLGIENTNTIGDGSGEMGGSLAEVDLGTSRYAVEISSGDQHSCVILDNDQVKCWGSGSNGRLGYGNQVSRGISSGSTNGMGDNLPYVNLGSSSSSVTSYNVDRIEVGNSFSCVIMNNDDIRCWGENSLGQLGYGDTENRGDGAGDLPHNNEVDLELDEQVVEFLCSESYAKSHLSPRDLRLDSSSSDVGDLIIMAELPSTGCPAIAYYDSGDSQIKFAAYNNGMWAVETLGSDSGVVDVDLVIDSEGIPHIFHMRGSDAHRISYTTKINGVWTEQVLTGLYALQDFALTIDSNDVLNLYSGKQNLRNYQCSSSCESVSNWNQVIATSIEQTLKDMDTVVDAYDNIHGTFMNQSGLIYFDEGGNFAMISDQINSDGYMATSIDAAPDGTLHIAHTNNSANEAFHSYCSADCTNSNSWSTSMISENSSSQITLEVDSDGVPWVLLTHASTGATLYNLEDGQWENKGSVSGWPGTADSWDLLINEAGNVYSSLHLVSNGELWLISNPIFAGTGFYVDADGDGWTGLDEIRCQTDALDPASIPADFDEDGICDRFDTKNDLHAVGESNVIAVGDDFGCAILDDNSVSCWGKNDAEQLGNSGAGASSNEAVSVDLPAGFYAVDLDAGSSHACAVGDDGSTVCWGANDKGQLGIGTTSASEVPSAVSLPSGTKALSVSAGSEHTCVSTSSGSVYCWGEGSDSQTGEYYISSPGTYQEDGFESGDFDALNWKNEDSVDPWYIDTAVSSSGTNSAAVQVDANQQSDIEVSMFTAAGNITFDYKTSTATNHYLRFYIDDVLQDSWSGTSVSAFQSVSFDFDAGQHTFKWISIRSSSSGGNNKVFIDNVRINSSTLLDSGGTLSTPSQVELPASAGVIEDIATGERHTCALNTNSDAFCWGYNGGSANMVLGNSSTTSTNSSSAVQVDLTTAGSQYSSDWSDRSIAGMSAGQDATCVLLSTNLESLCWGQGYDDKILGNSTSSIHGTRVDAGSASDKHYSISVGSEHACIVVASSIECWGTEVSGELGDSGGASSSTATPVSVSLPAGHIPLEVEVSESGTTSCALFKDADDKRKVMCWGEGGDGRIGHGLTTDLSAPSDSSAVEASGSDIIPEGSSSSVLRALSRPVEIDGGEGFFCARSIQGLVKCWGKGAEGRLGVGNGNTIGDDPGEMGENLEFVNFGDNKTAVQISVGSFHACAVLNDATIKCWGRGSEYQLGLGNTTNIGDSSNELGNLMPSVNLGGNAVKVTAGNMHTCALLDNGDVKCWGKGDEGIQGDGSTSTNSVPVKAQLGDYKAVDIEAGSHHTCAILENGAAKCWGQNSQYQLGLENTTDMGSSTNTIGNKMSFLALPDGTTPVSISAGEAYSCLVQNEGYISCWGYGGQGRLGYGSTGSRTSPWDIVDIGTDRKALDVQTSIEGATGWNFVNTIGSREFTCSIGDDELLRCWGDNYYGQLGIGNTYTIGDSSNEMGDNLAITDVGDHVESVALGKYSACAIREDGQVRCWGYNGLGNLGHEDTIQRGDQTGEMGDELPATELWMKVEDTDADGTIDLWDTDDDNDGTLDDGDDFPLDECAILDTDADGKPDSIVNTCTTTLIEDLDDDGDNWNDTDEDSCNTNPLLDSDTPKDFDLDGTCDYLDTDDDNDTFSDEVEGQCEPTYGYSSFMAMSSTSSSHYLNVQYGSAIWFDDEYGLRVGAQDASSGWFKIWTYEDAIADSSGSIMYYGGASGNSNGAGTGGAFRYPQVTHFAGLNYMTLSHSTYEMDAQLNTEYSQQQASTSSWSNSPTDVAFSPNGTYYLSDSNELDYYDTITGESGTLSYPTGVSGQQVQIAIDHNEVIHLVALESGSYEHWTYESGSWDSGETIWSGNNDVYYKEAQLRIDSTGTPYFAVITNNNLMLFNKTSSWNEIINAGSSLPTYNSGLEMKIDTNDNPHLIWNGASGSNKALYHTYKEGTNWRTELVRNETSWSSTYSYGLSMTFDNQGDIYIFSSNNQGGAYPMIHYKGLFDDPSKDANNTPPDSDNDGICDVLDTASLNYENLVWEEGVENSVSPIYTGLWPNSVSISPALPSGVTLDTSTGIISGTFEQSDVAGTTYTISTTSSGDNWQDTFTIRVQEMIPLLTGYEYGPASSDSYAYGSNGIKRNKVAFDSDGSMYLFSTATGSDSFSGHSISMTRDDDAYLAKRNGTTGEWDWVEVFDTCNQIQAQDIQISDSGSIYLLADYRAKGYSNSCNFDFRNSDALDFSSNGVVDTVVIKYDSSGSPIWVSHTNGSTTGAYIYGSNLEVDANENITVSGSFYNGSTNAIDFAGTSITTTPTSYYTPYVARLNPDGSGAWAASPTANDTSQENIENDELQVASHPDGSATLTFMGYYALKFDNLDMPRAPGTLARSVVAHLDAGGSWVWVKNVSATDAQIYATPSISSFSDGSIFVGFSDGSSDTSSGTLNLLGMASFEPTSDAWFAAARIDSSGSMIWSYFEDDFGMRSYSSATRMYAVTDDDDNVHVMMDAEDSADSAYFRTIAFDIDGNIVYQTETEGGSSTNFLYDFGLDSYGAPFYFMESNYQYWGGSTTTTDYGSSQTQGMTGSYAYIYRTFSTEIFEAHEVETNYPIANQYVNFYPVNTDVLDYATSWTISPSLPSGLNFQSSTGRIFGTASSNSSNVTYTINVTLNHNNPVLRNSHSFQLTFPVADPAPNVIFDSGDLSPVLERGAPMATISPTSGLDDQYLSYFTTDPALPSGLSIDSATGDISGTPNVNLSSTDITIKACNNWGVCKEHTLTLTINEPLASISYSQAQISLKKEEPMADMEPSNSGGAVETWEIDPSLPVGMEMSEYGVISGIPVANQDNTTYTIFANNSGGSVNTTLTIAINGTGMYIFYPYDNHRIAVNHPLATIYPSQRGAAAITWEITPSLPQGMEFGEGNGSIWGTPIELISDTTYTVSATGIEPDISAITTINFAVLLDIDSDGIPDESDDDDDGDGWSDTDEAACGGTDASDPDDAPFDGDGDGICDSNDDVNDAPILLFYDSSTVEISLNLEMSIFEPTVVGGDVTSWSIDPYLPLGLTFSGSSPARDGGDNGSIFGTPTELSADTVYTITASNAKYSSIFVINMAVLLDTDLDGTPDRDDDDDDDDGWSDEIEFLCGKDSLNGTDTPADTDNDQICDYVDDDDDGDGFIDSEEQECGSDWRDSSSVPVDADDSGVCDGLETDTDQDGWLDGIESSCGTDANDVNDVPTDLDNDFICDSLDDDKDNDGHANFEDDFPEDAEEWLDTDLDGIGDNADMDDDNDSWTDMWEGLCNTDSKSNNSVPSDFDSDMICDLFDDDIDNDGVSNEQDAFDEDVNETADFDGDGIGDNSDDDDDGDLWLDEDEVACGTDPFDNTSTPEGMADCDAIKKSDETVEETTFASKYWWICVLFLLLLLFLVPLFVIAKERGESIFVILGMRGKGPMPQYTTSVPDFISGSGTKVDPFILQTVEGVRSGKKTSSKESITITNLQPETTVRFMDLNQESNEGRFNMADILVEEDDSSEEEEHESGSISFKLKFEDIYDSNDGEEYTCLMRVGDSSVYFQWTVSIKDPSGRSKKSSKDEEASKKAKSEAAAAKKKELEVKKKAEEDARKRIEEEDRIKKAEEEARAKAEAEVKAKADEEDRIKKAEEEARAKAEAEVKAKAEDQAAAKLAEMEAKMAEKMAALEDKLEGLSKKEAELARISAKAELLDLSELGETEETTIKEEIAKGSDSIKLADASEFPESGKGYVNDGKGENLSIKWKSKDGDLLTGVSGVSRIIASGAKFYRKDELQKIKGIGPFIEEKLNALGLYTFLQLSKMDAELEDQVNIAIEFFPGRVKRDKWVNQAKEFAK